MKKYTVDELTDIFKRNDDSKCAYTEADREKVLSNPLLVPILDGLKKQFEEYAKQKTVSLPFTMSKRYCYDGDRKDGEYWHFYNRRKMRTNAIMAWLYGEKEYIAELEDSLWAVMDEYMWNIPAHVGQSFLKELQEDSYVIDLFSADTGFMISEILALMGDKIEPIIHKRARRMIDERCFNVLGKPFFWKKTTNNWTAVIGGQIGMTAIRMKNDPKELADIIYTCLELYQAYFSGFPADGACREGVGYWDYGMRNFTNFAELLYRRTNGEINLFDDDHVREVASFQHKCYFPSGKNVTFSDSGNYVKFGVAITMKLHEIYPEIPLPPKELWSFDYSTPSLRMLLWAPTSLDDNKLSPNTYIFPQAQWYITSSASGIALAAKAGCNFEPEESHNHNDVGAFHIYKDEENLIADVGPGVYNKKYFNPEYRYDVFACSSRGHSLPIINGEYQQYGEKYRASNVSITKENGLTADIAGAYEIPELESLVRNIRLDTEDNKIYLKDVYKFSSAPKSVTERFVTYRVPVIYDDYVIITSKDKTLKINFDKNVVKPKIDFFEDKEHLVRYDGRFKVALLDFEVINPTCEFVFDVVME